MLALHHTTFGRFYFGFDPNERLARFFYLNALWAGIPEGAD